MSVASIGASGGVDTAALRQHLQTLKQGGTISGKDFKADIATISKATGKDAPKPLQDLANSLSDDSTVSDDQIKSLLQQKGFGPPPGFGGPGGPGGSLNLGALLGGGGANGGQDGSGKVHGHHHHHFTDGDGGGSAEDPSTASDATASSGDLIKRLLSQYQKTNGSNLDPSVSADVATSLNIAA